jgi:hypothetical protein
VISTVDPEARHTRKSTSNRKDGFRGHVSAEPETGLITDAELTSAAGDAGSDPVVGQQMIARDRFHRPQTQTPHPDTGGDEAVVAEPGPAAAAAADTGDSGEISAAVTDSADAIAAAGEKGAALRGARRFGVRHRGRPRRLSGRRCAHCDQTQAAAPGRARRIHPQQLHHRRARRHGHQSGRAHPADEPETYGTFGRLCADCPLRCTTAADGRSMSIHPHEQLLRAARAQARTPEFKRDYPTRSSVERIIAWVATQRGRRVPSSTPASPARRSLGAGLTARAGSGPLIGTRPSPTLDLAGRTTTLSTNQV